MPDDTHCAKEKEIDAIGRELDSLRQVAEGNSGRLHLGDITLVEIKQAIETLDGNMQKDSELTTKIYNRMFIDNGKKSFQSVLATTSTHIRIQWFILGAIIVAAVVSAMKHLFFGA